jgi:Flp pilus assembly protein TadG
MVAKTISAIARRLWRDERGAVTAELVLAVPLIMLLLLAIVQFVLWSHATHIAQAAASQGLAAARAESGSAAAGETDAQQLIDELAAGPLVGVNVIVTRDIASASVQISGTASPVLPFLRLPVHAEAAGPVERFVPDQSAGR